MRLVDLRMPVLYTVVRKGEEHGLVGVTRPCSLQAYEAEEAPVVAELSQGQWRFPFRWAGGSLWHKVGDLDPRRARTIDQLEQVSKRNPAAWTAALKAEPFELANHPLRTTFNFIGRVHHVEFSDSTEHPTFLRSEARVLNAASHHCVIDGQLHVESLGPQLALTGLKPGSLALNYRHPDEYVQHLAHRAVAFHYSEFALAREITGEAFGEKLHIGPAQVNIFDPLPQLATAVSNLAIEAAAWLAIWNVGGKLLLPSRRPLVTMVANLRAALEARWPDQSLRFAVSGGNSIWPHAGWQTFPDPGDLVPCLQDFLDEGSHGGEWWSPVISAPIRAAIAHAEALREAITDQEFRAIGVPA